MPEPETLDTLIGKYYGNEMTELNLINYEARIAISKGIRDYTNKICVEYFKISSSVNKVKKDVAKERKKLRIIQNLKKLILYLYRFP